MASTAPVAAAGNATRSSAALPVPDLHDVSAGLAAGLRSLRLVVLMLILFDVLTSLVASSTGYLTGPSGLVVDAQSVLVAVASAAVMWGRRVLAPASVAAVLVLALTVGPSGEETTLLLVLAVVAAVRFRRRTLVVVLALVLAWAVALGVYQERDHGGYGLGAAITVLVVGAIGTGIGLAARLLLAADRRRSHRLDQLARENADISAQERRRLADELQVVVTVGLADIETEVVELDGQGGRTDVAAMQAFLARVAETSRSLLAELRSLLEVLRSEHAPRPSPAVVPSVGWARWVSVRNVRIAATVVFGLLALPPLVLALGPDSEPGAWLQPLALTACAVAFWRPWGTRIGVVVAGLVLVFAAATRATSGWEALAVALLCLVGTAGLGVRRIWLVLVGLVSYEAIRLLMEPGDLSTALLIGYAGVMGALTGLAVANFQRARTTSDIRQDALLAERERLESDERNAVARELHDVVAHQLSVTAMVVMGSGGSTEPEVLRNAVEQIRRCTGAARTELDVLLHTMRGAAADEVELAPLTSPVSVAASLGRQLRDAGHHPEIDVDPEADELDPTSQRTVTRIMQEATTNILRYAPVGSRCRYALRTGGGNVDLSVASPLAGREPRHALSLGWGLRGVQERVELTHGTFRAGPDRGEWLVAVTLPRTEPSNRRTFPVTAV